jgi:ketosteroid isomerase-like protein
MKKRYLLIMISLLVFTISFAQQSPKSTDQWKEKLKSINNQLADAFLNKDINVIMKYYDDKEPVCMPEYHKTLYTKAAIKLYYQQWFNIVKINAYKRDIYEVRLIEDYLVEIGTFTNNFTNVNNALIIYDGKYMNVWKINKDKNLTLISEIWGANSAVDKSSFSFIQIQVSEVPKPKIHRSLENEVNKRNELIADLVKKREGEKHATELFTKDAIYMTYDTPMLIGMEHIKPYFTEHEKPNGVSIDSLAIKASKIIDLHSFVIEYAYYYVDVSWNNKKGKAIVTGKSTNLWKRDENGILMLYRQMVNHD